MGQFVPVEPTCRLDGNAYINDAPNLTKFAPDVSQGRGKMVVFGSNTRTPSCSGIVGSIHISEQNNGKAAEPPSFTVSPDEYLKMCAQGPEGQKGAGGLPIKVVGNVTPNSHPLEYGRLVRSANSLLPADITGGLVIPPGTKTLAGINVGGPLQEGYGSGGEWQPGKFTSKEAFETSVKANGGLAESSRDFGAGKVLHSRRPIEAGSEPDGNSISERFASVAALHKAKLARDSEIRRNAPSIAELNGRMTAGVTTPVVLDKSRLGRGE